MRRAIHVHMHRTADAGQFDESKHKRDGGKFSATAGKSASNAEHAARAVPDAEGLRKEGENTQKGQAHNEALAAWAEARKHLDPDKPMAEQSTMYKQAVQKAEEASTKAAQLRRVPDPDKTLPGAGKGTAKDPADKPARSQAASKGKRAHQGAGSNEIHQAGALVRRIKKVAEQNDPDRKSA